MGRFAWTGCQFWPSSKGDVDAELGAYVQQSRRFVVLTDHTRVIIGRYPIRDLHPGCAVVRGAHENGAWIVELVPRAGKVGLAGFVVRGFDGADERPLSQLARRNVLPRNAAVARYMDQSVVAGRPQLSLLQRRFS